MPLAVKDYTWDETETTVHIVVPLKGVKANKVDIFSTDEYIKVSFPPYIFEVALFEPVDDGKGSAQVGNGAIKFDLVKQEPRIWTRLTSVQSGDKDVMKSKRQAAVEAAHARAEQEKNDKAVKKREAERYSVKQQMELEAQEKQKWMKRLIWKEPRPWLSWKNGRKQQSEELANEVEVSDDDNEDSDKNIFNEAGIVAYETDISREPPSVAPRCIPGSEKTGKAPTPAPRTKGSIEIKFTPRVFPTPQRESRKADEDTWLKKQAEARRVIGVEDPDLTEEEKNPDFLKDKGDKFYQNGNYLAAVNAYNQALKLNGKLHAIFSNRAACHLQIGNLMKCIEDCSKAIELLTPPVEANANSRLKAHIRRGTAFCRLELYVEGLMDYDAALKISPDNPKLIADANKMRTIIQSSNEAGYEDDVDESS
uniref:Dynein axonemal assembly factor 4 n=1 Tax=Saccoglossus kowalevskii TaxID=10224 RepID=A0ABM0LXD9_SACKO|nr:PREDICTED: LOW QUALITY PROTEIN: dyslexia susceptibility 1 candidate gene 1 protein homolog [Saccoglossus kowalevskii]